MAKDQTEVGITGKPVPKPTTAKKQYELEKKRRMQKHLGTNVGGTQYSSGAKYYVAGTSGSYNPRARTFEEFVAIAEAVVYGGEKKKPEDKRMVVTAADRKANTKAWQNYQAGHSGYRLASHLNKEEVEIAEAKVEAGMSDIAKKDIRSRRFVGAEKQKDYDAMGSTAANWVSAARLRAHRKRDELNKDAKDIRRGKLDKPQFQGKTGQERIAIVKKEKGMQ